MKRRRNGRNLRHVANLKKGQREVEWSPLTPRLVLRVPSVPSAYSLRLSRVSGVGTLNCDTYTAYLFVFIWPLFALCKW